MAARIGSSPIPSLFLDFLAGNQTYECTPWSMPLRTVFGWQKPCYLLGEGYVKTFKELMEGTEWEKYGVGKYEKCANCMVHCGFEGTAVTDAIKHPLKLLPLAAARREDRGPMAPDIDLSNQRPAEFVFSRHVENKLAEIKGSQVRARRGRGSGVTRGTPCRTPRPVRISSGICSGSLAAASPARAASAIPPFGFSAHQRRRRQHCAAVVGDHPQHHERQAVPRGEAGGDWRFHVDRQRAGCA